MRNIAPDQSGCIVTDEVHDPISNKLCRGGSPPAARTPQLGPTLRAVSFPRVYSPRDCSPRLGAHRTAIKLVPKWCYTT